MNEYESMDALGTPTHDEQELRFFVPLVIVAQILGLASVVVTAVWMGHYWGGFQWTADLIFNYHPLFMVIGMVFLYADAILAYRVFRNARKFPVKLLHAGLQMSSLVFAAVGLIAVFNSHNWKNIPNLYSIHSWLGLAIVGLFALQWIMGFLVYLLPCAANNLRTAIMPFHRGIGIGIFTLAVCNCLLGISEKNFFSKTYSKLDVKEKFGNGLCLLLVMFAITIIYIVTKFEYRRIDQATTERIRLTN